MLKKLQQDLKIMLQELQDAMPKGLGKGHILVIGTSTSEILGKRIGTAGSDDVAQALYQVFAEESEKKGYALAFQCCEHLNRALVIEKNNVNHQEWSEVLAIPVPGAGGSMAACAYEEMEDPILIESIKADAGIDIGDTFIGMHLKHVAVPVRSSINELGGAHVTMARTRPKLIGGPRAVYERTSLKTDMKNCR